MLQSTAALLDRVFAHPVLAVFLVGLALRTVAALTVGSILDGALISDDAHGYQTMVANAAEGHTAQWDDFTRGLYDRTATFTLPLTLLYAIVGPHAVAGRLLLGLVGAGVAAGTTRLALVALPKGPAVVGGLLVALLPSQILFSVQTLKDPVVWLLAVGLTFLVVMSGRSSGYRFAAISVGIIALLFGLAYVRVHSFVVACLALTLVGWIGQRQGRWVRAVSMAVIGGSLPLFLGLGAFGLDFATAPDIANMRRLNALGAASGFVPTVAPEEALLHDADTLLAEAKELEGKIADLESGDVSESRVAALSAELYAQADALDLLASRLHSTSGGSEGRVATVSRLRDVAATLRRLAPTLSELLLLEEASSLLLQAREFERQIAGLEPGQVSESRVEFLTSEAYEQAGALERLASHLEGGAGDSDARTSKAAQLKEVAAALRRLARILPDLLAQRDDPNLGSATQELEDTIERAEPQPGGNAETVSEKLREQVAALESEAAALEEEVNEASRIQAEATAPVKHVTTGLSAVLLRPYPWEAGPPALRMAGTENLVWYSWLTLALLGLVGLWSSPRSTVFAAFYGGGMVLVLALAEGNLGTAFRHRGEVVWVVALFAVHGIHHLRGAWAARSLGQVSQTRPWTEAP